MYHCVSDYYSLLQAVQNLEEMLELNLSFTYLSVDKVWNLTILFYDTTWLMIFTIAN